MLEMKITEKRENISRKPTIGSRLNVSCSAQQNLSQSDENEKKDREEEDKKFFLQFMVCKFYGTIFMITTNAFLSVLLALRITKEASVRGARRSPITSSVQKENERHRQRKTKNYNFSIARFRLKPPLLCRTPCGCMCSKVCMQL